MVILPLAACSQDAEAPVDSEVAPTSADDDEVLSQGETSLADETDEGPTRAAVRLVPGIPAPFTGVWDYADGNCDAMSDLRMEIEPQMITFYESMGEVQQVAVESRDTIVVDLNMEGEGERWSESTRFTLEDDGERLIPTDADGEQRWDPMPRKRCPQDRAAR
ncbi:hypothetical protein D6201_11070 [Aurantiacibacter aquimixticola]|uniref:Lipoprotein n=2 Tax=Aurantiacibacter aquimixticola TaxID=1958945 RepID=A0A419RVL0_9SPHN|nr:hypothetical protein D6201_11070 [Aurantiacibacter aquimixticola]